MATHSSVLAWRIPGMGEPGGLLSRGSHRVRRDWSDLAAAAVTIHSDFGAEKNKISHCFHFLLFYLPRSDGIRCHDLSFLMLWWRGLCDWMKLWAVPCRALSGWVIVETSDKTWSARREWQTTPAFLPRESHEQYRKTKWGEVADFSSFRIYALRVTSVLDSVDKNERCCLMLTTLDPLRGKPVGYAAKLPLHLGLRGHVQGFQEMESV